MKDKNSLYEYKHENGRKIVYVNKEKLINKTSLILRNNRIYQYIIGLSLT